MNQATLQQVLCRPEYGPEFSYMLSASTTFSFFQLQSVIFSSESSTRHANLSSSTTSQQWHHSWTLIFICRGLPKLLGCAPATARKGCPERAGNPMIDCYTCKLVPRMRSVHRILKVAGHGMRTARPFTQLAQKHWVFFATQTFPCVRRCLGTRGGSYGRPPGASQGTQCAAHGGPQHKIVFPLFVWLWGGV